jgi:hypothetical protein
MTIELMSTRDLGETVYAIFDAYDGPIEGVADYQGIPHYFWRIFDKTNDDWTESYTLQKLTPQANECARRKYELWRRWRDAFQEGRVSLTSHPVFPEDHSDYEEAKQRLSILLEENPNPKFQREGRFIVSELRKRIHDSTSADGRFVKWRTNARIEPVSERDQTE